MTTRETILNRLRSELRRPDLPFPLGNTPPLTSDERMTVTAASGTLWELAERFGAELTALHGTYEIVGTPTEARLALINRLLTWREEERAAYRGPKPQTGQEDQVLGWADEALPVPGIADALADLGIEVIAPAALYSSEERDAVRFIRYGVTGVQAAFAGTGSMLMVAGPKTSRAASLLPLRHIALIPFSRLYPAIEDWLAAERNAGTLTSVLRANANVTLITGPSKSADIEMNLTLGVHGPKFVHAILFEDDVER
ncbi:MAG: lactate utilization protein [Caldilineaceae bacterium]|nr:lactate utilization protein [Caldilineaceae bacterium]